MRKDWVPCFGYGVTASLLIPGTTDTQFVVPLVGTGLGVDPAGNQVGFPDTDPEEVTIHRTVGQWRWRLLAADALTEVRIGMRFTTATYNQTLGALFPFTLDLNDGADANEGFFHERRFSMSTPDVDTTDVFVDPHWSMFDLTSKRRLQSAEWTCCVVDIRPIGPQQDFGLVFDHFLRSWVTTK